jgi:hypothetical protein
VTNCSVSWTRAVPALPPDGFQRSMPTANPAISRVAKLPIAPPIGVIQSSRRSSGLHLKPAEALASLPRLAGLIQISLAASFVIVSWLGIRLLALYHGRECMRPDQLCLGSRQPIAITCAPGGRDLAPRPPQREDGLAFSCQAWLSALWAFLSG